MDLQDLGVLLLDCQATGMNPQKADLLDVAWCPLPGLQDDAFVAAHTFESLVALPPGRRIPARVRKITGISTSDLRDAPTRETLRDTFLATLDDLGPAFVPVAHYARYERPFFEELGLEAPILCTHEIAKRLLPDLPKLSLRALAGYLGASTQEHKRASSHVAATATIWRELVPILVDEADVHTLPELLDWLAHTKAPKKNAKRTYALPREVRLALPKQPGVYRLLNRSGGVLYVGKATSLKDRVNSYFRSPKSLGARKLEMVSQVHGLDVTPLPTPLHAALLETDEIKRLSPPYNEQLRERDRRLYFAPTHDPARFQDAPFPQALGPFSSLMTVTGYADLTRALGGAPEAMLDALWGLDDPEIAAEGLALFLDWNRLPQDPTPQDLLALGRALHASYCIARARRKAEREAARLAAAEAGDEVDEEEVEEEVEEAEREEFVWTPPAVSGAARGILRRLVMSAARGHWLTLLADATLTWQRTGEDATHRLDLRRGQLADPGPLDALTHDERLACFDVPTYDRLSVVAAELRRLVRDGHHVTLTLGAGVTHDAHTLPQVFYMI